MLLKHRNATATSGQEPELSVSQGSGHAVLIIEDDEELASEMATTLADYGIRPAVARALDTAKAFLQATNVDLVLLDQELSSVDAFQLIPSLRSATTAPIVVVTGNRLEVDRIVALEIGADDFLLKPIAGRELVARVRAHLRRAAEKPPSRQLAWSFDPDARTLRRPDGFEVALTAAEFDLLAAPIARPGEPLTREDLTPRIRGRAWRPEDRALDNLVLHLRKKLAPGGERSIATIRNRGYVFTAFPRS